MVMYVYRKMEEKQPPFVAKQEDMRQPVDELNEGVLNMRKKYARLVKTLCSGLLPHYPTITNSNDYATAMLVLRSVNSWLLDQRQRKVNKKLS